MNTNNNLKKALESSIQHGTVLTAAYLNQNFSQKEITDMEVECKSQLLVVKASIIAGSESAIGLTKYHAALIKTVLEKNLNAIRKTRKRNSGIEEIAVTSIEKKLFHFDLNQN